MSRLHLAESMILFARNSILALAISPRPFFEGSPVVFCVALPTSAISKVNAIIPRERTWEFVLFAP